MAINVTPTADLEIKRLMTQPENTEFKGLRVSVKGGGCSGLSYAMEFDRGAREKDQVFDYEGFQVYCDPKSYLYLDGLTLDYSKALIDGGFRFENPNAKRTCSCGTSFSA